MGSCRKNTKFLSCCSSQVQLSTLNYSRFLYVLSIQLQKKHKGNEKENQKNFNYFVMFVKMQHVNSIVNVNGNSIAIINYVKPLIANLTKWSNTFKQIRGLKNQQIFWVKIECLQDSLSEKCPYSELFWSYFPAFGLNTERYQTSADECRRVQTTRQTSVDEYWRAQTKI